MRPSYSSSVAQQGATLIVVMVLLVIITLMGTWAIRGSITSLNIAANAQAHALLQQTSDAVFFALENQTSDDLILSNMQIGDGMLAYVLRPENVGKELVFCIRGGESNILEGSRNASVVYWDGNSIQNTEQGTGGFCRTTRTADFISSRAAVLTRVAVRAGMSGIDWEHLLEGDDKESSKQQIQRVVVSVTSLIPNLSKASATDINACISNYTSFKDPVVNNKTVTDCLGEKNVPYNTQEMMYTLRPVNAS